MKKIAEVSMGLPLFTEIKVELLCMHRIQTGIGIRIPGSASLRRLSLLLGMKVAVCCWAASGVERAAARARPESAGT